MNTSTEIPIPLHRPEHLTGSRVRCRPPRSTFTEYVRCLRPGHEPGQERVEETWEALHRELERELRRRSLWTLSPSCLGVYGYHLWRETGAMEELVYDAHYFIFGQRLRGLRAHLRFRTNIDGLIILSLRNFLHERQKKNDPLGFRVFEVLRLIVYQAIEEGQLEFFYGSRKTLGSAVLGFGKAVRLPCSEERLREIVQTWNDDLLPDLVTARGRAVEAVRARLAAKLRRLPDQGVRAFRFRDLAHVLQRDVRRRWKAVWKTEQGELGVEEAGESLLAVVRVTRPEKGLEERERFQQLLSCVEAALETLPEREDNRIYLRRLLLFFKNAALDVGDGATTEDLSPSCRHLQKILGIPRKRLPGLLETLRNLFDECGARPSSPGGET